MKSIVLIILCITVTAGSVFGQFRTITEAEYDAAKKSADAKIEKLARRVTTQTTTYKAEKVDTIETLTQEYFPNGDERWNSITKRGDQIVDTLQLLYFGKYEYRKEGEKEWEKSCFKDCSKSETGPRYTIAGAKELPKVQEFLRTETITRQNEWVYVFSRVYQFGAVLEYYTDKTWIDADGLIRRQESLTSAVFPTSRTASEIVTYEYDPKDMLPIEPPIK